MNGAISRERKDARPLGRQRQQYGSTGTISTELNTLSSSSSTSLSQESSTIQPGLTVHGLSLDLSLASSEDSVVGTGHSRISSSFSDISDEGGYCDRAARHRHRSRANACNNFFETTLFTVNNFKLIISVTIWFISYMIMGIFGGSVAYMHFQRSNRDIPDPLPDFGYDVIPVSKMNDFRVVCHFVCAENDDRRGKNTNMCVSSLLNQSINSIGVRASHTSHMETSRA